MPLRSSPPPPRRTLLAGLAVLVLSLFVGAGAALAQTPPITVFAAASLTDALKEAGAAYTQKTGTPVVFSFAASGVIARQIEAGARADVFISADTAWMDYLQQRRLIDPGTRRPLLGGRLALVAPAGSTLKLPATRGFRLREALRGGRLAIGDPRSVPAGRYAERALTSLGVWMEVADRTARADNVRAALAYVARGEAPLGIVYETDALAEPRVRIVSLFPASSHPPIVYPAAATAGASAEGRAFLAWLRTPEARGAFTRRGFRSL